MKKVLVEKVKSTSEKAKIRTGKAYKTFEKADQNLKYSSGKGIFHSYSEKGGDIVGKAIATPLSMLGKKIKKPYVVEIAEAFHGSAKFSGGLAGQITQGTWKLGQGMVKKNRLDVSEGFGEYAGATGRTVKAMYKSAEYTLKNSGSIISGLYSKDYKKAIGGIKGVGKVIIVGTVAITVFDLAEGDNVATAQDGDFLSTRNDQLDGQLHSVTGVYYEAQTVELPNGSEVVGVFPVFDAVAEVQLPVELYESTDANHFLYANQSLSISIDQDPSLGNQFTAFQLNQLNTGLTPEGYSWHHHEQAGKLQLVDEETHSQSGHSGGRSIWGGGDEAR